jgi:integrase
VLLLCNATQSHAGNTTEVESWGQLSGSRGFPQEESGRALEAWREVLRATAHRPWQRQDSSSKDRARCGQPRRSKSRTREKTDREPPGKLPRPGHKPKFEDAAADYLASGEFAEKKLGTRENEQQAINRWNGHLGGIRVDKINFPIVHAFREKRLKGGASKRTVNLDVVVLRNVLRFLKKRGDIDHVIEIEGFEEAPAKRKKFPQRLEYKAILEAIAPAVTKNSDLFRNYIQFLALTGARELVRWSDVDFAAQQVTIGRGGVAKNEDERAVDFSPELKDLLTTMEAARPPDSSWLSRHHNAARRTSMRDLCANRSPKRELDGFNTFNARRWL